MFKRLGQLSVLQATLLLSVLLHAAILSVRFVNPEGFRRVFETQELDVVLVNARSEQAPDKAQALAQHQLVGGGESEEPRRISTPLPAQSTDLPTDDANEARQRQAIRQRQQEQEQLLTEVRQALAALPVSTPEQLQDSAQARAQEERRLHLKKMLGAIEKRIEEENARPRKRFLSPATMGVTYARYYDDMRLKIEATGTANFPQMAGRKLYGELLMALLINHDGSILDAQVVQSSGNRTLDRLAEAIAQKAAPFGAFTPDMRQETDRFDITARFHFTREHTLQTQLQDR